MKWRKQRQRHGVSAAMAERSENINNGMAKWQWRKISETA